MSVPAAYIGVIIIWSTTPLAIQWSGDGGGYLFGAASRMLLGVMVGLMIAGLFNVRLPWHRDALRTYLVAGFSLFLAMTSVYWAAQFIPSGWLSVLFGLAPIVTGLLATIWLAENALTVPRITGMLLGVAGLAVMLVDARQLGPQATLGIAGILFSMTVHSVSTVVVKRIAADIPALATSIGGLLVAVPLFAALFIATDRAVPASLPERTLWSIVYLGVVGSVFGAALYFYILKHVEATRVALITLITPVLALLFGHLFNGEVVRVETLAGAATILSGLLLFEYGQPAGRWLRGRLPQAGSGWLQTMLKSLACRFWMV